MVRVLYALLCFLFLPMVATAQTPLDLDETCRVKVGNRTAQVRPDGTFLIRNVAIFKTRNTGILPELNRVRATCLRNGEMVRGQSDYFSLQEGEDTFVLDVFPSDLAPIPRRITVSTPQTDIFAGETLQLTVTAHYDDGSTADISSKAAGTTFLSTRSHLMTVSEDGVVTGVSTETRPKRGLIMVLNEGNLSALQLRALGPSNDTDNDGMPNDFEDLYGLNNFSDDSGDNLDGDGLTNLEEYQTGTLPNHVDTDLDTLLDGFDNAPLIFDDQGPSLAFTSPLEGQSFLELEDVPVAFEASDSEAVAEVELRLDGALVYSAVAPPFSYTFPMPRAVNDVTLEALARDTAGNVSIVQRIVPAILDAPPELTLVSPPAGQLVGEGTALEILAEASDDIELLDVTFTVDGVERAPITSAPFIINHPVAVGATEVTIDVVARDRIQTTVVSRTVTVTSDPLTTVSGRTVDADGLPLAGAQLTTNFGGMATSDVNGDFSITNLPTLQGDIQATALASVLGGDLSGRSGPFAPVPGGTTLVGDIVLRLRSALYPGRRYDTGDIPRDLDFADFDGDGFEDVVVANFASDDLSVLLGEGNGNYAEELRLASCDSPREVVTADFDGDGSVDIAATCSVTTGNSVSIHLGTGLGTFAAEQLVVSGTWPTGLTAADFDADGQIDLAVTNRGGNDVSLLSGNGDGTFQTAVTHAVGASPTRIEANDVDSDGDQDLVVLDFDGPSISLLSNQGDGTFAPRVAITTPEVRPDYLTLGDYDGDGLTDAAVGHHIVGKSTLWKGTGTSFLADGTLETSLGRLEVPHLTDIDGDNDLDLLVGDPSFDFRGYLLRGAGDGTFAAEEELVIGAYGSPLVARDVDGDGDLDLVALQNSTNNLSITQALAPGVFNMPRVIASGETVIEAAVGDFNLDGHQDVAAVGRDNTTVVIHLGNGDGSFQAPANIEVDLSPQKVVVLDYDDDGFEDLAVANKVSNSLSLLRGRGDGTFEFNELPSGEGPQDLTVADFNGDGAEDLALVNTDFNTDQVGVHLASGGSFAGYQLIGNVADPQAIVSGDFDEDGNVDLAVGSFSLTDLTVFLGNGDGTFQVGVGFADGDQTRDLAVGDLDLDGHLDLVAAHGNQGDGVTSVHFGRGDGTFETAIDLATRETTEGAAVGDLNLDGIPDIVVGNGEEAVVILSNGDRTFRDLQRYTRGVGGKTAFGDFNEDGRVDLITPGGTSDTFWLLLQQ